ncbi:MAG TPA: anthranilate phosphoribosyltransferase [Gammaproteobacteria bacterium]|nr:anthranilate phosphoribosyltransferase [Gammaproteobacteria bacterium]
MNLRTSIEKLMLRQNLDSLTCQEIMSSISEPDSNQLQLSAFLALLRSKTETPEELAGMMAGLKQNMLPVITPHKVLDIVGTGGDGANTVNISTGSAILAASCGIKIAKHGNRSVSSLCGSADALEALGININLSPEKISESIDKINIAFCFAPNFHPALKELRALRKQLNIPTTLNIIAPLLNPANPEYFLFGVYDKNLLLPIAKSLSTTKSFVVHGSGLDEISCIGPTTIVETSNNTITQFILDPKDYGFEYCSLSDLRGGNAETNNKLLLAAFSNKHKAIADTLILNAGVALYIYGLHHSIAEGIAHAKENLQNGSAITLLNNFREFSHDI